MKRLIHSSERAKPDVSAVMEAASAFVAGMLDQTRHPALEPMKMRRELEQAAIAACEAWAAQKVADLVITVCCPSCATWFTVCEEGPA